MGGSGMGMGMTGHSGAIGHHHQGAAYSHQNYGHSSYYSNTMDYLSSSQLNGPVNHFAW